VPAAVVQSQLIFDLLAAPRKSARFTSCYAKYAKRSRICLVNGEQKQGMHTNWQLHPKTGNRFGEAVKRGCGPV
jgi:hypothetical protein